MIDTHAHIYDAQFSDDIDLVVSACKQLGISRILMPNIDEASVGVMDALAKLYPGYCLPMMGLHPCSVTEQNDAFLQKVDELLATGKYLAVGEIGTDLYWDKTYWSQQQQVFQQQCEMGLTYDLPVVIHCRETIDETIALVKPFAERGLKGVFHCFTGSPSQAKSIKDMGFYLGIGGVVTFKNGGLDKTLDEIGTERLVLETDSPYLAPTPHRGKRNSPTYLPLIAQKIAEITGKSVHEIKEITDQNATTLFGLDEL